MCVSKRSMTVNGFRVEVPCNVCWSCRENRISDLVGRAVAEAQTADNIRVVALTWGNTARLHDVPDEFSASTVNRREFTLWMKRLRRAGVKRVRDPATGKTREVIRWRVRFLGVSEFGPKNGRVHMHVICYFRGPEVPDIALDRRHFGGDKYWHHGITYWQKFKVGAAFYVIKYALKSQKVDNRLLRNSVVHTDDLQAQSMVARSDRPPLGIDHFRALARRNVEQGLAPRNLEYRFPDVWKKVGDRKVPRIFRLKYGSACADAFLKEFVQEWALKRPGERIPASKLVEDYLDGRADLLTSEASEVRHYRPLPSEPTPNGETVLFDEKLNCFFFWLGGSFTDDRSPAGELIKGGYRPSLLVKMYWSFDPEGRRCWFKSFVGEAEGQRRKAAHRQATSAEAYAEASASRRAKAVPPTAAALVVPAPAPVIGNRELADVADLQASMARRSYRGSLSQDWLAPYRQPPPKRRPGRGEP